MTEKNRKRLKLKYKSFELRLRHTFTVSACSRTVTPGVLTEIEYDGLTGYGEASMPPYLGESTESVIRFLSKVDLSRFGDPLQLDEMLDYIGSIEPGNYAAKASADIALHDLAGKIIGRPWFRIWGMDPERTPYSSMTIGIDNPLKVREKVLEAEQFRILKIKMGKGNEREMMETIRQITDKPVFADVNQGWTEREYALDMIYWLSRMGVVLVEQPMPAGMIEDLAWLNERSPIPVIADEGIRTPEDMDKMMDIYSGVNIKLMKCGGLRNGYRMLLKARKYGLKVMIGCMTETSCGISAAAQLSPEADWADLDGNYLISNDCFRGVQLSGGKISLTEVPGIGIIEKTGC